MTELKDKLEAVIREKGFLIVSHRGVWGGNIIQNTRQSAELAKSLHADVVEIDIARSADGEYYLFHNNGAEGNLLKTDADFTTLSSGWIEQATVYNTTDGISGYSINRLDEFLGWLPEDYVINFDRAWDYFKDDRFIHLLKDSGKTGQFFVKSAPQEKYLETIDQLNGEIAYIPIIEDLEGLRTYQSYSHIPHLGYEIVTDDLQSPVLDPRVTAKMKEDGAFVLVNAENLGVNRPLIGSYSDDGALLNDGGDWQAMLDLGATAIQTDWPYFLNEFRADGEGTVGRKGVNA